MIFQLIYTCALATDMLPSDLESLAEDARKRNLNRGITGILLCKDGSILQVLEGEKSAVLELYANIARDARVSNPLVMIKRTATEREFPNWSMGIKNASDSGAVFELCAQSFPEVFPLKMSPEVSTIGRTFARVNGLT